MDILDTGKIVSFSAADRSLFWHAADGGAPESRRNILNATAMAVLPGTSDVVIADSRGAVAVAAVVLSAAAWIATRSSLRAVERMMRFRLGLLRGESGRFHIERME